MEIKAGYTTKGWRVHDVQCGSLDGHLKIGWLDMALINVERWFEFAGVGNCTCSMTKTTNGSCEDKIQCECAVKHVPIALLKTPSLVRSARPHGPVGL